jgi:cytochrome c oxidase subunit 1
VVHEATGLAVDKRQLVTTSLVDARPQVRESSPAPSIWPLIAAMVTAGLFIGSIFTPWAIVWGVPPLAAALIGWFWPKGNPEDES